VLSSLLLSSLLFIFFGWWGPLIGGDWWGPRCGRTPRPCLNPALAATDNNPRVRRRGRSRRDDYQRRLAFEHVDRQTCNVSILAIRIIWSSKSLKSYWRYWRRGSIGGVTVLVTWRYWRRGSIGGVAVLGTLYLVLVTL
jgi:hypothetical protein